MPYFSDHFESSEQDWEPEEKNIKISRLNLCDLTAKTLKLSLKLLGIETLERM